MYVYSYASDSTVRCVPAMSSDSARPSSNGTCLLPGGMMSTRPPARNVPFAPPGTWFLQMQPPQPQCQAPFEIPQIC